MARYKAIKTEDRKYKLTKKRHRICNTVYIVYAILFFTCILIGGINQHNSLVVGWDLIAMGIISIPVAMFSIYTTKKGWEPQLRAWAQDSSNIEIEKTIITIIFILCSVIPTVLGILKLFNIF
jgi:TRAP-type C4-dicarboxylate transport system permease small subunit